MKPETVRVNPHDYLDGTSPSARGQVNERLATTWLYLWGYSSAGMICALLQKKAYGWTTNAKRRGIVRMTKTRSGSPRELVTLTETGQALAEQNADEVYEYREREPESIVQATIWHQLLAQKVTIDAMHAAVIVSYRTERQEIGRSRRNEKKPDVVWILENGDRVGIEIELTSKFERRLDEFVFGIYSALSPRSNKEEPSFAKFIVITDSNAIAKRYAAAMTVESNMRTWKKSARGVWVVDQVLQVPVWLHQRVEIMVIER